MAGIAYLGIGTSSWVDLALVAGEVAMIAALAISVLVKIGPAHYSAVVLSPASSPNGQFTDITNALIYGITAFAGFETAAALGEEARNARRSIPASTIGIVIVTGLFYLLVVCAETFGVGRQISSASPSSTTRWAFSPSGTGRRPRCGLSISWSCSPALVSSPPWSTRSSGSCSPWDANGFSRGHFPGFPAAAPRPWPSAASRCSR